MIPVKAVYNGIQHGPHPFELWTILEPMNCPCHTVFSSVSRETLAEHGYTPQEEPA